MTEPGREKRTTMKAGKKVQLLWGRGRKRFSRIMCYFWRILGGSTGKVNQGQVVNVLNLRLWNLNFTLSIVVSH